MAVQTQIQWRRGTAASWTSTNPTLAAGEVGLETDTGKFKVGTGSSTWTALAYGTVLPATLTAKGSILAASAASTPAELAVGNNGETLVADSSTSTGLRWQANTFQNAVYNSAFDIWQRGTSFAPSGATNQYCADRWLCYSGVSGRTISRQSIGNLSVSPNQVVRYAARVQRDSGNTNTATTYILGTLETSDSIPFAGKTVTLSFYARAGANFSATSSVMASAIRTGTGTDENTLNFTGFAQTAQNNTLTTSWQRFSQTVTLATTVTELGWSFEFTPVGTASTNDWFEVTGVQLEQGSVATPFHRQNATIQGELAACQRYYIRNVSVNTAGVVAQSGYVSSTTNFSGTVALPVTMRVVPTSVDFSTIQVIDSSSGAYSITAAAITGQASPQFAACDFTISGATAGRFGYIRGNASASAYLGFSAEL